ncbi:MAG: Lon protease 1 [Anaerolineae bacterium]|nr:Lon protease 1 [Anaerolineae bacterium]RIK31087.1 MAG: endopeptidase La [Chloroflexota bacterium]
MSRRRAQLLAPNKDDSPERLSTPEQSNTIHIFPLVPARDTVVFPRLISPITAGRERSVRAIEEAMLRDQKVVVFAQRDPELQEPGMDDLYTIGAVLSIGRMLRMPDGTTSVLGQGEARARLLEIVQTDPFVKVRVEEIAETRDDSVETQALCRMALAQFEKIVRLNSNLPEEVYVAAMNAAGAGALADLIASSLNLELAKRQEILETLDGIERLNLISRLLANELQVLELQSQIHNQVQEEVDKNQREYYLREQMRVIQHELGEMDAQAREVHDLRAKIAAAEMPEEARAKAEHELERIQQTPFGSPELGIIRTYLDWLIQLPWKHASKDNLDIAAAAKLLDEQHYGLKRAKERILEYMAVRKLAASKMSSPVLCFVGPPGTGKTSMGRSIAQALGRNFVRVSLGGIRDEAEIRGHRRTYIGAMPGRIIQTIKRAKAVNPVFMLDEIDKVGADFRGDPSSALLEVLDPEQNNAFSDHYLEVPYDLSKIVFITTANLLDPIPPALLDRMEVIEFPGYIEEEKLAIAKQFIIPRQLEQHGLAGKPKFSDAALRGLIRDYSYEAGVRNLEREIAQVCRKIARHVAEGKPTPATVTKESLNKYLGPAKFIYGMKEDQDQIGVATGLAVTGAGGDTMAIEVTLMPGKGSLLLTGQLGDVMQESAQAALSYARTNAKQLALRSDFDKLDIHIHVPEGAIPKDGPSAGITIATALISALSQRAIHKDVGFTGEITLRGRVLPIGGVREKILAAHRAGLKTLIMPKKNKKDLVDLPRKVQRNLNLVLVENMDEVLPVALTGKNAAPKTARRPKPAPRVAAAR